MYGKEPRYSEQVLPVAWPFIALPDLATERKRHLTTGKRTERTKLDSQCLICRSATGLCFTSFNFFYIRSYPG